MRYANFLDVLPDDPCWGHAFGPGSDGVRLHYVRQGQGPTVVLMHGWPGFWYDWRRIIPRLAETADVIAPDFRGFGDSDKPTRPPAEAYTVRHLAGDITSLLDHLGIGQAVLAGHDIGAAVAQVLARTVPQRVLALALFNPSYPGVGARRFEPAAQCEFWYQHFHNLPWADQLIGYSRDTVRLYLGHFYDHWTGRKEAVRPSEFEAIVDVFTRPGAVRASLGWYRAREAARSHDAAADPKTLQVAQPTFVLWGEADPVIPVRWSDRLAMYFPRLSVRLLPGVGHFVPFEAPDETTQAIRAAMTAS